MSIELFPINPFDLTRAFRLSQSDPGGSHWLDWYVDQWTTDWIVEGSTPARTAAKTVAWVALKLFALTLGTVIPVLPYMSFVKSIEPKPPGQQTLIGMGWEIFETIGRGSCGKVKRVKSPAGTFYAFKEIPLKKAQEDQCFAASKERGEALAAQLPEHESLLQTSMFMIYDRGAYDIVASLEGVQGVVVGTLAKLMENNPQDLFEKVRNDGSLSREELKRVGKKVAEGLACMHAAGFMHRDIKPENILVNDEGEVKIIDFGYLRALQDNERTMTMCGTSLYMAPEVILSPPYGHKADVWSFGVTLFDIAFGFSPFDDEEFNPFKLQQEIIDFQESGDSFKSYVKERFSDKEKFVNHSLYNDDECWDLLNGLVHSDPHLRIKMEDVTEYRFFGGDRGFAAG